MKLQQGLHLAYCTNIHRGETWTETLDALERYTLAVRDQVSPGKPYAIGLRLSDQASRELAHPQTLLKFQKWLEQKECYVFTINGFPFGRFHGTRIKEKVYAPDWSSPERLEYTNRLFDLLAVLVPAGVEGSVSTLPGSFKEFIHDPEQVAAIRQNIRRCAEHIERVAEACGRELHLGLEPEPLGLFENTAETVRFFSELRGERFPQDLWRRVGVNYDTCHFAVEFEDPRLALEQFRRHAIRISKFHLSSALKVIPTPEALAELSHFAEDTYLHQVMVRGSEGFLMRYRDLGDALREQTSQRNSGEEWRIHFHIPLQSRGTPLFQTTADHLLGVLDIIAEQPDLCSHLEMETYTWEVMPPEIKNRSVVDQLVAEYGWTLEELRVRQLAAGIP